MSVREYVGARYVPKFADPVEWQADTSYEALTIVTYNNSSYTSKVPVPSTVGNPASNGDYWVVTGNYSAQVQEAISIANSANAVAENAKAVAENLDSTVNETKKDLEALIAKTDKTVKDYGAKGDGSTDDIAAINACMAAENVVIFPEGVYMVSSTINVPRDNMYFIGEHAAHIKCSTDKLQSIINTNEKNNLIINNLEIDGNSLSDYCILDNLSDDVKIYDCNVHHALVICIGLRGGYRNIIDRCTIEYTVGNEEGHLSNGGVAMFQDDQETAAYYHGHVMRNCHVAYTGLDGVLADVGGVSVINNDFSYCGRRVKAAAIYATTNERSLIAGNTIRYISGNGIDTHLANFGVISNNIIEEAKCAGIMLSNSDGWTVNGNACFNCGDDPIEAQQQGGLSLINNSRNILVTGNLFVGNTYPWYFNNVSHIEIGTYKFLNNKHQCHEENVTDSRIAVTTNYPA